MDNNTLEFIRDEIEGMLMSYAEMDNVIKARGCFVGRLHCLLHLVNTLIASLEKYVEEDKCKTME